MFTIWIINHMLENRSYDLVGVYRPSYVFHWPTDSYWRIFQVLAEENSLLQMKHWLRNLRLRREAKRFAELPYQVCIRSTNKDGRVVVEHIWASLENKDNAASAAPTHATQNETNK